MPKYKLKNKQIELFLSKLFREEYSKSAYEDQQMGSKAVKPIKNQDAGK